MAVAQIILFVERRVVRREKVSMREMSETSKMQVVSRSCRAEEWLLKRRVRKVEVWMSKEEEVGRKKRLR